METPPKGTDSDPAVLDELVFRYLEDLEATDSDPDRLLDEFCAEEPGYDAELRNAIKRLQESGLMPTSQAEFPERMGDFRLERRLGSGGMGVVFLAEQVSLGRQVALKIVRPEQLYFQRTRERFKREVESAARLAHAGIAQVYTVGEEDGIPYFAQEFIAGASLDVVLRAVPSKTAEGLTGRDLARALTSCLEGQHALAANSEFFDGTWEEVCLRIVRSVADALQHAHERGVLHRDVKPSNLILTPDGRVVLVDFGLANLSDSTALTRTGAQLGSLPYMSPEQVDGRAEEVGPASDVYGLGVALYELLTLRAPYGGESSERLRRLILEARALAPRVHNATLNVDAETVCLCAMDPDPSRRYASAAAFSEDLTNVLESRPTNARPLGSIGRSFRWLRRNPAPAIAGVLAAILLIGGPVTWGVVQTSHAANMKRSAERESLASKAAEEHFQAVLSTLNSMIRRIGDRDFAELPGTTAIRLAAIDEALEYYDVLQKKRPNDTTLAEHHTWAHHHRGQVLSDMHRFEEAIDAYGRAIARLDGTLEVEDDRRAYRIWECGSVYLMRANCRTRLWDHKGALADGEHGLELLERSIAFGSSDSVREGGRVSGLTNVASSHRSLGDYDSGQRLLRRARELAEGWGDEQSSAMGLQRAHVQLLIEEARFAMHFEEFERAVALRVEALERLEIGIVSDPDDKGWHGMLVPLLTSLAGAHDACGELIEHASVVERAVREARSQVEKFPNRALYRTELTDALGWHAHLARLQGNFAESRELMVSIAEEWSAQSDLNPDGDRVRAKTQVAWINAANVFLVSTDTGQERYERALEYLDRAAEIEVGSAETYAETEMAHRHLIYNRSICFGNLGRIEEARECIAEVEAMPAGNARDVRFLADMWNEFFLAAEKRNEFGDVELGRKARLRVLELLEEAVAKGYSDFNELSTTPVLDSLRGEPRFVALLESLQGQ